MDKSNSHQIKIDISPWEEKGFKLDLLHIWETIGEKEPGGHMQLSHDGRQEAVDFITSQQTGVIKIKDEKDGGQSYEFGFFITSRDFINNIIKLDFTVVPAKNIERGKTFYTQPRSETYPSISAAIEQVWPGDIIKNIETDISGETKIYQDNESGYSFLSNLCYSWKYKSVYAFSWDGLVLKNIGDDVKPVTEIEGNSGLWEQTNQTTVKYRSRNNNELFNPWTDDNKEDESSISKSTTSSKDFKDLQPKYVSSSISRDVYRIHAPEYSRMEKNQKKNSEFRGYQVITICAQDMPKDWKIGDVIGYRRLDPSDDQKTEKDLKSMKYVVAGSEFFFTQNGAMKNGKTIVGPNGHDVEWTATLWGLEKLDINKEIQNNKNNNNE